MAWSLPTRYMLLNFQYLDTILHFLQSVGNNIIPWAAKQPYPLHQVRYDMCWIKQSRYNEGHSEWQLSSQLIGGKRDHNGLWFQLVFSNYSVTGPMLVPSVESEGHECTSGNRLRSYWPGFVFPCWKIHKDGDLIVERSSKIVDN